jgi:hypothetical protein
MHALCVRGQPLPDVGANLLQLVAIELARHRTGVDQGIAQIDGSEQNAGANRREDLLAANEARARFGHAFFELVETAHQFVSRERPKRENGDESRHEGAADGRRRTDVAFHKPMVLPLFSSVQLSRGQAALR